MKADLSVTDTRREKSH